MSANRTTIRHAGTGDDLDDEQRDDQRVKISSNVRQGCEHCLARPAIAAYDLLPARSNERAGAARTVRLRRTRAAPLSLLGVRIWSPSTGRGAALDLSRHDRSDHGVRHVDYSRAKPRWRSLAEFLWRR